ncbi:MAG: hypothetical protein HRU28_00375 [Rhizobiales bacterium]|nr:hypothetical protein [Hyphomicrobiales bacterium]
MTQLYFGITIFVLALSAFTYLSMPIFLRIDGAAETLAKKMKLGISAFAIILSLCAFGLYSIIGSPYLIEINKPVSLDPKTQAIIEQIEAHLSENPEDAEGWQVVAPTYLATNEPQKAFEAFANAIKFGNSNGKNWLGLGKANLMVNRGVFGPMSKVAFTKAHEKSPDSLEAMFFYASMLQNSNQLDEASQAIEKFIAGHSYSSEELVPLSEILNIIRNDSVK